MQRSSKMSIFFGVAIFALGTSKIYTQSAQPNIKVLDIEKCEVISPNPIPWTFELNNADGDGRKKFDGEFDFRNIDFTDGINYTMDVDRLNDGEWENKNNQKGNLCDVIKTYVMKAWENMLNIMNPRPLDLCHAQQDIFVLKNFEIAKADVQIPPIFGLLRVTTKFYDENNNAVLCAIMNLEVSDE